MSKGKLIVVLHNVSSISLCRDFVRTALGLGARDIVFTKASGSAAMSGVPVAQKLAYSNGANFLFLKDLPDAIELLQPSSVYLFIRRPFSNQTFDATTITQSYLAGKTIFLVFGGSEPGLSKRDLDLGIPIYFSDYNDIGSIAELTLSLYLLRQEIQHSNNS